jgi:hypothetical protein
MHDVGEDQGIEYLLLFLGLFGQVVGLKLPTTDMQRIIRNSRQ